LLISALRPLSSQEPLLNYCKTYNWLQRCNRGGELSRLVQAARLLNCNQLDMPVYPIAPIFGLLKRLAANAIYRSVRAAPAWCTSSLLKLRAILWTPPPGGTSRCRFTPVLGGNPEHAEVVLIFRADRRYVPDTRRDNYCC